MVAVAASGRLSRSVLDHRTWMCFCWLLVALAESGLISTDLELAVGRISCLLSIRFHAKGILSCSALGFHCSLLLCDGAE